jgi:uncharacterized protein (TIGR02145 family)
MLSNLAYGGAIAGTQVTTKTGDTDSTVKYWVNPTASDLLYASGNPVHCTVAYNTTTAINYLACGYLYNWCSALGSGSTSAICSSATSNSTNIANAGIDLCPTNWRLPTQQEYNALWVRSAPNGLANTVANIAGVSSVWRGVYSGLFDSVNGLVNQGAYGRYWSATTFLSTTNSYVPTFATSAVYPENFSTRYFGFAVRCVIGSGT